MSASAQMTQRIAIIGGGIAGLAAACELQKAREANPQSPEYTLFEAAPRLGGTIKTDTVDGCVVEAGPDSFLTAKPAAAELARELGLGGEIIHSRDAERRTYMLRSGRLVPLPDGLQLFVPSRPVAAAMSPLFSWKTKLRFLREWIAPPVPLAKDDDESVAAFVERHFGRELVEQLAGPLLAGVFGGEADALSSRAAMPRLVEMEAESRSLVRHALRAGSGKAPGGARPLFTSLRGGMGQLVEAAAARLSPGAVRTRTAVTAILRENENWNARWRLILSDGRQETFSGIIVTVPPAIAAALLRTTAPELSHGLAQISSAASATIALGFSAERVKLPRGFGFLVPQSEGRELMACTFVHQKFAHRAPEDVALLRGVITRKVDRSDDELVAAMRGDLSGILGIEAAPLFARVQRWPTGLPQFRVGHLDLIRRIEAGVEETAGLALAGNYFYGVGISDAIQSGQKAAARLQTSLGRAADSTAESTSV